MLEGRHTYRDPHTRAAHVTLVCKTGLAMSRPSRSLSYSRNFVRYWLDKLIRPINTPMHSSSQPQQLRDSHPISALQIDELLLITWLSGSIARVSRAALQ